MYEPENESHQVFEAMLGPGKSVLLLKQVANGCQEDGNRNEEFNPVSRDPDQIKGGEDEGERMPNRKGSDQNQNLFPVNKLVYGTERNNKENMVITFEISNVAQSQSEIHFEYTHSPVLCG